jgi:hypothetical protein
VWGFGDRMYSAPMTGTSKSAFAARSRVFEVPGTQGENRCRRITVNWITCGIICEYASERRG